MSFLDKERAALERLLPSLGKRLADHTLAELEHPESPGLAAFREAGGAGLLVPTEHGGCGASARDAVLCTRALGAHSPSLAVAATMHNFSVASLVALAEGSTGFEWMLLDAVARDGRLMSSAFAEGRTAQGILSPTMPAHRDGTGWRVSGSKKPCSLSRSMDVITASIALTEQDGSYRLGIAVIPADSTGVSVRPFWQSSVLNGAESDELVLEDVWVQDDLVVKPELDPDTNLDALHTRGLIWFTLLVTAAYLGAAGQLAQRLVRSGRGEAATRAGVLGELESSALALDAVAHRLDTGKPDGALLADALVARYATQAAIRRAVDTCVEQLGGMAFISSPDVACLAAATHALAFHPPSRMSTATALDGHFAGQALRVD